MDREAIRAELEHLVDQTPAWEPSEADDGGVEPSEPTQAQQLVKLAADAEFFHTPGGECYATVPVDNHRETWPIKWLRSWLVERFYRKAGKPPSSQALQDALRCLSAKALYDGEEHPVFIRWAQRDGAIYLDLCNRRWEVVEITGAGYRMITDPPVKFRRTKAMLPLPKPQRGGSLQDLRRFVNVADRSSWLLILSWLVAAMRPQGPFPILVLQGEQGTAKSTLARLLRSVFDPVKAPLRAPPRNERDLAIGATNSWCVAYDNLSGLAPWLADALCRLATGGGLATRELYTDAEEVIFDVQRPVVLNGITDLAVRQDLTDRAIVVCLKPIPPTERRTEAELWQEFEAVQPRLLGALLEVVAAALRNLDSVELPTVPRMADFAVWASAAETALGFPQGAFLAAYDDNRSEAVEVALEADPVAVAVRSLTAQHAEWSGTATELLEVLGNLVSERTQRSRAWPKSARSLSCQLKRSATGLRTVGIEVESYREPDRDRRRLISIRLADAGTVFRTQDRTQDTDRKPLKNKGLDAADGSDAKMQPDSTDERVVMEL